jgi:hypothetical protein
MSGVSRRTFIKQVSAGAAGVAAVGALGIPKASAHTAKRPHADESAVGSSGEQVMAFVRDGSRGDVTLLVGHREIVHHDPELVRQLRRAAK